MKTITLQQVVDKNYEWFVVDKNPRSASEEDSKCAYRGNNGTKCAIGCVIPDNLYESRMDLGGYANVTVGGSLVVESDIVAVLASCPDIRAFFKNIPANKLQKLQLIHDTYWNGSSTPFNLYMDQELRKFANENKLTYPS